MILGKYDLGTPAFLAPMAGITDKAFREVVRQLGGKFIFSEMISDKALLYSNPKTLRMLNFRDEKEPRFVQLFGSEPEPMAEAAKKAVAFGADIIDINMGCPTPKIVKNGEGAALLQNLPLAVKIASRVVENVNVPVTVKMRLGWDHNNIVAPELARRLENVGVTMVTIHARTREQFYSGKADWEWISRIKQAVKIPVIGNGDILTPVHARSMLNQTGCDGVMIARGALGRPWVIGATQYFLDTGEAVEGPKNILKYEILSSHFEKLLAYKGEKVGVNEIRKHAAWYLKGVRGAAHYRSQIMCAENPQDIWSIFQKAFDQL
jgi:nifR3 family TIM-barrel protein